MDTREKLEKVLEEKVNPLLQKHYGGVRITDVSGDCVKIKFIGACGHCDSAPERFEDTVKRIVLEECPQIREVIRDTESGYDFEELAKQVSERAEMKRHEQEEVQKAHEEELQKAHEKQSD